MTAALACSYCFNGGGQDALSQGASWGVIVMIVVVGGLLLAIASMALFWAKRAAMIDGSAAYDAKPPMKLF